MKFGGMFVLSLVGVMLLFEGAHIFKFNYVWS